MAPPAHIPVLLRQVVVGLEPRPGGIYVDATLGLGGHAAAILEIAGTRLVGLDVDEAALAVARERLAPFGDRATVVRASYHDLSETLADLGIDLLDGILFDLGVSSLQLDTPSRGFSFRTEGPLDMRFSGDGETAAEWLAEVDEDELVRVLRDHGEEPRARRVARAIVRTRERGPITTTSQLASIVRSTLGHTGRIDPATRTFQAIRIATNRELDTLGDALTEAARLLRPAGRLAVIAFHSLEDRIVKRTFKHLSGSCTCPPGRPLCNCEPENLLEVLTRRPLEADPVELIGNPRARSAKLRVAARRTP
jgi:16S rRNA (cytosine1402-N4)-methyltransferase